MVPLPYLEGVERDGAVEHFEVVLNFVDQVDDSHMPRMPLLPPPKRVLLGIEKRRFRNEKNVVLGMKRTHCRVQVLSVAFFLEQK